MCGRYASTATPQQLETEFDAIDATGGDVLEPSYNVAPTDGVYIVRESRSQQRRVIEVARWGLVPFWAKDPNGGAKMINARAESVSDKPAFRTAFERHRALVPADGWYEWARTNSGRKQAYYMTPAGPDPDQRLAFAGLWAVWGHDEQRLLTSSVVTVPAVGEFAEVHERMPLVLPADAWEQWLNADVEQARALLEPAAKFLETLEIRPVGAAVGNVRNNGPELIERATPPSETPQALF